MIREGIVIFGAGYDGKLALERIGVERVSCFVDNNNALHGSYIGSKRVISFDELLNLYKSEKCRVVIPSKKYFSEIYEQLCAAGIEDAISVTSFLISDAFNEGGNENRILLMNTHAGTNIGDQLISVAEHAFFKEYLPEYTIVELPADLIDEDISAIKRNVYDNDIIAITGGGYMGSLWKSYGEDNVRNIIDAFPNNHIIVMPQSVYFEETPEGKSEYIQSKGYYNKHAFFKICAREKRTYNLIENMMEKRNRVFLIPDMAELLDESESQKHREMVGICLRNDKESIFSSQEKEEITSCVREKIDIFDMHAQKYVGIHERNNIVSAMIERVSGFKYVITDRLHCMILCAITGTPCIAFDNLSGKVHGVYEWIKSNEYIKTVDDIETAKKMVDIFENNSKSFFYDRSSVLPFYATLASLFK